MSEERKIPGRASSQVSIYDYPEHLNPFYEDENHKRLRFWKINSSSKGQNQKAGRSNSFSFSGLKDIWAFKSFKLKKKSSTLGINKTSESPPELRRVYPVGDTYNTVDSRSRHTYDIGLGNNFQRSGYRSSLQNVHSTGGDSNGFYRNDRYRSTIQNGSQTIATSPQRDRYVYSGSVTPTPRTRYVTPQSRYGSSQTSINSTNPFEEDDNISRCESVDGVSLRKRKKRKAPQPPVTCPSISTNQQACTTVEEISGKEDLADISNLTAEIETFVRTHDNDQEKLRENNGNASPKKKEKSPPIPPARTSSSVTTTVKADTSDNDTVTYSQTTVTIEKVPTRTVVTESHNNHSVEQADHPTATVIESEKITVHESVAEETERRKVIDRKLGNSRESPENNEDYPERTSQTPDPDIENVRLRKFNSEKKLNVNEKSESDVVQSPPRIIVRKPTEDWEYDEEIQLNGDADHVSSEDSPKTPISSEVEFILEHNTSQGSSEHNTSNNSSEQNASPSSSEHNISQSPSKPVVSQSPSKPIVSQSPSKPIVSQIPSAYNTSQTSSKQNTSQDTTEHNTSQSSSTSSQKLDSEVIVVETVQVEASRSSNDSKEKPTVSVKKNFENSSEKYSAKSHECILDESKSDDVPELKIVESTDDLSSTPTVSEPSDRYKIRFVALKSFSPEAQRRDVELRPHNDQEFDVEDVDLPPAPPQRRRSVKDIIASINKSQSLLKINQKTNGNADTKRTYNYDTYLPQTIPTTSAKEPQPLQSSDDSINRKYSELEESERKMRKMISDMEQSSVDVPLPVVEKFDEFVVDDAKSGDLFKKCVVRRDKNLQSGSGASQDENRSSLEWNPLPKPRRSRNLTHELENGKI
ncbi:hypothetical protein HA402_010973 [Bradysia odoriphaga]|nr:hypothetical protein HA402_010973 [Bradysia odoriphaga]